MNFKNKNLIELHTAVLLFGLCGLFGKFLTLPSTIIVLGRVFFGSISLAIMLLYSKQSLKLKEKRHYIYLIIMGLTLAIHWVAFFKSIQLSTVAIGLLTFSTFPVFVTFLEPYLFKEKLKLQDLIIAIITLGGVALVIPKFEIGNNLTQGALWGIFSGLTFAILSVLNRKYVKEYSSQIIAFYQQGTATIVLLPFLFIETTVLHIKDVSLLILLGVVFTALAHGLYINSLKNIKAQSAGIIASLEPVYGIIFALILLREIPTLKVVIGGVVILGAAFYVSRNS